MSEAERAIRVQFRPGHPFWDEACVLRQRLCTIAQIVDHAKQAGLDLSWTEVNRGLKKAPADLFLPTRPAEKMRRRFETLEARFDSYVAIRNLALQALEQVDELEDELLDHTLSPSRRIFLEGQLYKWYGRAFDWAKSATDVGIAVQDIYARRKQAEVDEKQVEQDDQVIEGVARLVDKLEALTGGGRDFAAAYGPENVSEPDYGATLEDEDTDGSTGEDSALGRA